MITFWFVIWGFETLYALWVFYLAVMNLKRAKDAGKLSVAARVFGTPVLVVGYLLDMLANVIPMTLILVELPRETTVTSRLKRHITGTGWRARVASWMCKNLLDAFDPSGCHCD